MLVPLDLLWAPLIEVAVVLFLISNPFCHPPFIKNNRLLLRLQTAEFNLPVTSRLDALKCIVFNLEDYGWMQCL